MSHRDQLVEEGQALLTQIKKDCRESSLAGTFSGGFTVCRLTVPDPCARVDEWTERASAAATEDGEAAGTNLANLPSRRRKSLKSDSAFAVRCLKERLAALEQSARGRAPG